MSGIQSSSGTSITTTEKPIGGEPIGMSLAMTNGTFTGSANYVVPVGKIAIVGGGGAYSETFGNIGGSYAAINIVLNAGVVLCSVFYTQATSQAAGIGTLHYSGPHISYKAGETITLTYNKSSSGMTGVAYWGGVLVDA